MIDAVYQPDELRAEVFRLSDLCLNKAATADECSRLAALLTSCEQALDDYVEFISDASILRLISRGSCDTVPAEVVGDTFFDSARLPSEDRYSLLLDEFAEVFAVVNEDQPSNRAAFSSACRPQSSTLKGINGHRFSDAKRRSGGIAALLSRPIVRYAALVAFCLYGSFVLMAWNLRPDINSSPGGGRAELRWSKNPSANLVASDVVPGKPFTIEAGTIDFELKAGTKVTIEGPADWTIDGENRVMLRAGTLMARVPQRSIGFTVETATTKIVDLGTEFVVQADKQGVTEVQVLEGKVELSLSGATSDTSMFKEPFTLSAGSAVRVRPIVGSREVVVQKIPARRTSFVHQDASQSRRIPVSGTLASSEFSSLLRADNLVNGSGLRGQSHSSLPDQTMWRTGDRKVKNEYVLFDCGAQSRFDSMKVWNYNEHNGANVNYQYRGVAQADIYVSSTGNGTPLDHPNDWQLVLADAKFEPADGTPDYCPQQILLQGATGRFIAIVIDACTAREGDGHKIEHECVGLSEVQFFGVRQNQPVEAHR